MNWILLRNSLAAAGGATLLAGLLGLFGAVFAAALPRPGRNAMIAVAFAALVIPPFLVTNTWMNYFGLTGTWRPFIDFDIYTIPGSIWILALLLWPIPFALTLAGLLRIDRTYFEQEYLLRRWALCRNLLWPAVQRPFASGAALVFVMALNNFSVPTLLQTKVYAAEVWLSFNTKFDYIEALKLSWPLIAGPALLLVFMRPKNARFTFRFAEFPIRLLRTRLGWIFPLSAAASLTIIVLSIILPLTQLLFSPRTWTEFVPAMEAGRNAAFNSVLFGIVPALLVVLAGTVFSRNRAGGLSWIFFLAPGVLLGIALIWIFNRPGIAAFYQGVGIVILAFTVRYAALGWTAARAAWQSTDQSALDAIRTLGGSRWAQFHFAEWPQAKGLLMAGFYIVYLLCLWEVETLILIVPPGRETLALRIFNMLHYGHASQVDALCVWLLLFALAPLLLFVLGGNLRNLLRASAVLGSILLLTGCGGATTADGRIERDLQSKLFRSVQVWGRRGTGAGEFNKPRSLALDRDDNLYVVDITGRVQKFSPDGAYLLSWQMPQTDKGKPKGMDRDSDGNIIVVEPHYSRVNHFDPTGKLLTQWGVTGTNRGELIFPRSVAVNSHGDLFLSEYGLAERIQHFSARGERFIDSFGVPGNGPGDLNRAEGIGFDSQDHLFVADSCNHRVQVFSADGKYITAFGTPGSGPGEMSYPYDVRIDRAGNRFVCEFGNSRVQIFDAQNKPLEILGGAGAEPGQMNNPWAIAFDSRGDLYVADSLNHRIQKFIRREPFTPAHTSHSMAEKPLAAK